jgi:hypothetical protein
MKNTGMVVAGRLRKITLIPLVIFGLLSIIATGGGGGGGDGGSGGFSATSSGVANKGIIRHGSVIAEELDSSGTVLRTVGNDETNPQGQYSLTVGGDYSGGPILLTISGKSDGSTVMVCDVEGGCNGIAYGDTLSLGTDFSMHAIIPPVTDGEAISAQITPFTHMAAQRVLSGGSATAETVNNAISEVSQMVGVQILDVPPVDITDPAAVAAASPEALAYAAFDAGAGQLVFAQGGVNAGLAIMATAFEDGKFTSADGFSAQDLVDAVTAQAQARGINTMELQHVVSVIESQINPDGSYDPEPSGTATQEAVKQARALMTETRTWVTSLEDLQTPLDAFGNNLDTAGQVVDDNSEVLADSLGYVLNAVAVELESQLQAGTLAVGTYPVTVVDGTGTTLGTASAVIADEGGVAITVTASNINGVDVDVAIGTNIPVTAFAGTTFTLSGADLSVSGSVSNAQATMSLDQMDLMAEFDSEVSIDPTGTIPSTDPVLSSASLSGGLTVQAAGASFSGTSSMSFVSLNSPPGDIGNNAPSLAKLSLSEISLNGEFATASDSFSADMTLTVNNAADFDTLGFLTYSPDETADLSYTTDVLGAESYAAGLGIVSLSYANYYWYPNETCFSGQDTGGIYVYQCATGDVLDVAGYLTAQYPGAQSVKYTDYTYQPGYTHVTGVINYGDYESTNNFADVTLSLTLDLALNGYPDTQAVISGNRTAFEGGNVMLSLVHGGHSVTFDATKADGTTPGEGTLTVTNPDGVKLVVSATEGGVSGTLKVNSTEVGTVEETSNHLILVRYNDGTFETVQ